MRLILENFRCHRSAIFDIPNEGLVLVYGDNEVGKTTIFKALLFVLYGYTKKNPCSYKTKTCKVSLEAQLGKNGTITIVRTIAKPNSLSVTIVRGTKESSYSSEAAQSVIENFVGGGMRTLGDPITQTQFLASSYVSQLARNSVISMSPTDQLKFVECLVYEDDMHIHCKLAIKEKIKSLKTRVSTLEGEVEVAGKVMKSRKKKLDASSPHEYEGPSKEELEKTLKLNNRRLTKFNEEYTSISQKLKRSDDDESILSKIRSQITVLETAISSYRSERDTLGDIPDEDSIALLEKEVSRKKEYFANLEKYESLRATLSKIKRYTTQQISTLNEQISSLRENILTDEEIEAALAEDLSHDALKWIHLQYGDVENPKEFLECKAEELTSKITALEEELVSLEEEYTLSKELETVYKCPCCSVKLIVPSNPEIVTTAPQKRGRGRPKKNAPPPPSTESLVVLREKPDGVLDRSSIEKYESILQEVTSTKAELEDLTSNLSLLGEYDATLKERYASHLKAVAKIADLEAEIENVNAAPAILDLRKDAKRLRSALPKDFKPQTITNDIEELTSKIAKAWDTRSSYNRLSREIRTREKELEPLSRKGSDKLTLSTRKELLASLESTKLQLDELSEKTNEITHNLRECEGVEKYTSIQEEYEDANNEYTSLKKDLEETKSLLTGAIGLEETAKEAEVLSITRIISEINEYSKGYLDIFFDRSISVRLENVKMNAKGDSRLCMCTIVEDNGEESELGELSGGAQQKCELAFLLGVNDMLGGRVVMLDECVNNVDDSTIGDVIESIEKLQACKAGYNKLVLVISHGISTGMFGKIIDVARQCTVESL